MLNRHIQIVTDLRLIFNCLNQFVIDFFKYALVGMVLEWIRKDMKTDPVLLTQRLNKLLHGGIRRTLLKFQAGGGTVALPKD